MKKAKTEALESRVENCHLTDEGYFFGEASGSVSEVDAVADLGIDWYKARTAIAMLSSTASNIYSASKVYYGAPPKMAIGIRAKTLRGRVQDEAVRL